MLGNANLTRATAPCSNLDGPQEVAEMSDERVVAVDVLRCVQDPR